MNYVEEPEEILEVKLTKGSISLADLERSIDHETNLTLQIIIVTGFIVLTILLLIY